MGLSTKQVSPTGGNEGVKITDGVYGNLSTITKVRDLSGKKLEWTDTIFDLCLEVEFEEKRFPETFLGNLKKDASGEVVDWGGAFVVALLFTNCDLEAELDEDNRFPASELKKLVGQTIYTVSYTAGTYKNKAGDKANNYRTWNQTFPPYDDEDEAREIILKAWERSRDRGYPKDYTFPIQRKSGSRDMGQKSGAGKSDLTSQAGDVDDDLPF